MPLRPQAERFQPLEEQERAEGVQAGAQVAQDLYADLDGKGDRSKRLAELQAVVPFGGLGEVGEATGLDPVKLACRTHHEHVCRERTLEGHSSIYSCRSSIKQILFPIVSWNGFREVLCITYSVGPWKLGHVVALQEFQCCDVYFTSAGEGKITTTKTKTR